MTKPLQNKIAIVTGASRGIGAATARKLAQQGAQVIITYGKSAAEAEGVVKHILSEGGKAAAFKADAADPAALKALAETVVKNFGGIDILVNNAGTYSAGIIGEIPAEEYHRAMKINVDGVFNLTNAAVPHMKPGGRIIVVSSVLGERASAPGLSVYNASKFAATGLARSWAKDLGAKGILVNAVQPGPVNTEMNPEDSDHADHLRANTALGRYGKAEEIASVIAFLVGPEATYVTGATINVDGGWNA